MYNFNKPLTNSVLSKSHRLSNTRHHNNCKHLKACHGDMRRSIIIRTNISKYDKYIYSYYL